MATATATALDLAARHHKAGVVLRDRTELAARRIWRGELDIRNLDASWQAKVGPKLVALVAVAQAQAAKGADDYTAAVLAAQGLDAGSDFELDPAGFAGFASDGRPLDSLLYSPVTATKTAIGQGATTAQALANGLGNLQMIVGTQVSDAGRTADGVSLVGHRAATGYARILTPPSCPRCAILAGKWFRWNQGFQRHPRCDCRHVPSVEGDDPRLFSRVDPRKAIERGEVNGLTLTEHRAILDGADPAQVVNSRRGMYEAAFGSRRVKLTREGTTRRGFATHVRRRVDELERNRTKFVTDKVLARRGAVSNYSIRRTRSARLRPEEIYRIAGTRDEALRLLARNGYLMNVPGERNSTIIDLARFATNKPGIPKVVSHTPVIPTQRDDAKWSRWREGRDVKVRRVDPSRREFLEESVAARVKDLREIEAAGMAPGSFNEGLHRQLSEMLVDEQRRLAELADNLIEFDPANPLKFYGDKINFVDESKIVEKHLDELETYMPTKAHPIIRDHFADSRYPDSGFFLGDTQITKLDSLTSLAGKQPGGGWSAGSTYEQVAGVYSPGIRSCVCGGGRHGSESLVLHEGGHAFDDALSAKFAGTKASDRSDWRAVYNDLAGNIQTLHPHYHPKLNNTKSGHTEAWAESFDLWARYRGELSENNLARRIISGLSQSSETDPTVIGPMNAAKAVGIGRRIAKYFEDLERSL